MDRLDTMIAAGIISRFGCVLRHREIGYTANAMAVWDVDDERVAAAGRRLAEHADVTLCYRRNRWLPGWRYNLYAMVHGRDEPSVRAIIERVTGASGLAGAARAILFSRRCFVQRGARFRARNQVIAA
jgi:DNA-binding Lrp family transcriptional regulator